MRSGASFGQIILQERLLTDVAATRSQALAADLLAKVWFQYGKTIFQATRRWRGSRVSEREEA
jgi:hypothetical protein